MDRTLYEIKITVKIRKQKPSSIFFLETIKMLILARIRVWIKEEEGRRV